MSPVKVLGACGLVAAALTAMAGGFGGSPLLLTAGVVMVLGNLHAIAHRKGNDA